MKPFKVVIRCIYYDWNLDVISLNFKPMPRLIRTMKQVSMQTWVVMSLSRDPVPL